MIISLTDAAKVERAREAFQGVPFCDFVARWEVAQQDYSLYTRFHYTIIGNESKWAKMRFNDCAKILAVVLTRRELSKMTLPKGYGWGEYAHTNHSWNGGAWLLASSCWNHFEQNQWIVEIE